MIYNIASELSLLQQNSTQNSKPSTSAIGERNQTTHPTQSSLIPSKSNTIHYTTSTFPGLSTALGSSSAPSNPSNKASATTTTSTENINSGYPDNGMKFSELPTSSIFGNSIYAGSVVFETPTPSVSVSPLYPIQSSVNITFKWQYTGLRVRPVNVTLNAVGPNSVTYNITTVDGVTSEATWNLGSVPTNEPLPNGYYGIELYDQRGLSADIQPGWMEPCTTLTIALYTPDLYDPYTTLANYCPTCYYSAGRSKFHEVFQPICITFGVAFMTCVIFLYNVLTT
ncbi:hypothetical protein K501DRAFT_201714 [Backusella circina FSU 941]|nr:hypothetical protein K501DRAFT_201714 [Backusella circina FSU 941]